MACKSAFMLLQLLVILSVAFSASASAGQAGQKLSWLVGSAGGRAGLRHSSAHSAHAHTGGDSQAHLNLPCGPVLGFIETIPDNSAQIAVFRNIPYGAPPTRWAAPQAAACWTGTLDATSFGPVCVQPDGETGAEDCLSLSVYIPVTGQEQEQEQGLLPIFFYIHGGGLMSGSGNWESPQSAAVRTRSIAITVNYRLNIHGFLATSSLAAEQGGTCGNYGILDQQLALRWVRANARAFGGDQSRVTLGGQSSGGTSIFALLSSPLSFSPSPSPSHTDSDKGESQQQAPTPLFAAAVAWSGSPNMSMPLLTALQHNEQIVTALRCSSSSSSPSDQQQLQQLECLRAASLPALAQAIPESWNTPGIFGLNTLNKDGFGKYYAGLAIVDGRVIAQSFDSAFSAGMVDVPVVMGNTGAEAELGPGDRVRDYSLAQWRSFLNHTTAAGGWPVSEAAALAENLYEMYLPDAKVDPQKAYDAINADYGTSCPLIKIATRAKRQSSGGRRKSPVYLFRNEWQPSVPLADRDWNLTWAFHTWDYRVAFENWDDMQPAVAVAVAEAGGAAGPFPNPTDVSLARIEQAILAQMLHGGKIDPSHPLTNGWRSVEEVADFSQGGYGVMRISSADLLPYQASAFEQRAKHAECALFDRFGFDEKFWWVG